MEQPVGNVGGAELRRVVSGVDLRAYVGLERRPIYHEACYLWVSGRLV
jgi:hypothetical protein